MNVEERHRYSNLFKHRVVLFIYIYIYIYIYREREREREI